MRAYTRGVALTFKLRTHGRRHPSPIRGQLSPIVGTTPPRSLECTPGVASERRETIDPLVSLAPPLRVLCPEKRKTHLWPRPGAQRGTQEEETRSVFFYRERFDPLFERRSLPPGFRDYAQFLDITRTDRLSTSELLSSRKFHQAAIVTRRSPRPSGSLVANRIRRFYF